MGHSVDCDAQDSRGGSVQAVVVTSPPCVATENSSGLNTEDRVPRTTAVEESSTPDPNLETSSTPTSFNDRDKMVEGTPATEEPINNAEAVKLVLDILEVKDNRIRELEAKNAELLTQIENWRANMKKKSLAWAQDREKLLLEFDAI